VRSAIAARAVRPGTARSSISPRAPRAGVGQGSGEHVPEQHGADCRLLELARQRGVKTFLFASTNAVVGNVGRAVITSRPAAAAHALRRDQGRSGDADQLLLGFLWRPRRPLRFSNVYGPGMLHKDSFIPRLMRAARDARRQGPRGRHHGPGLIQVDDVITGSSPLGVRPLRAGHPGIRAVGHRDRHGGDRAGSRADHPAENARSPRRDARRQLDISTARGWATSRPTTWRRAWPRCGPTSGRLSWPRKGPMSPTKADTARNYAGPVTCHRRRRHRRNGRPLRRPGTAAAAGRAGDRGYNEKARSGRSYTAFRAGVRAQTATIVVADGCADATAKEADAAGALVADVAVNRAGRALRLGYRIARDGGGGTS